MKQANLIEIHRFPDKTMGVPIKEVDKLYLRDPDNADKTDGLQVQHYEVSDRFRIHGFYLEGAFHVICLDCKHMFHG